MRFSIVAGNLEIWRSADLAWDSKPAKADVRLPAGTKEVRLRVSSTDGNIGYAHADWADFRVEFADGRRVPIGMFMPEPTAPFSFKLGDTPSPEVLDKWKILRRKGRPVRGRNMHVVAWKEPRGCLQCRMEIEEFTDFPAVEWVLYLENTGGRNTPILSDIQALDWRMPAGMKPVLHRSRGSQCQINDFEYLSAEIEPGQSVRMVAGGGRSSDNWLPFFNLEAGRRRSEKVESGVIMAVGWSGQWAAGFTHEAGGATHVKAGMEKTHLMLRPGEEIRSPRILLFFWNGERLDGHNQFRQFILAHHRPMAAGRPVSGPLTTAHWGGMKSGLHLDRIKAYKREKMDYDYYWIDAGWYGPADSYSPDEHRGDWYKHVGNWDVNPAAHPDGLRPLSDAARKAGMRFLLWFEPERAKYGTPLTMKYPEWFIGKRGPDENMLFNLGEPEARKWMTDFIVAFIKRNRVDLYRQDFNFEPLPFWIGNDTPDRQGMTEIRYVEGLYAYWDQLLSRCRGLVIDNCASGGRRIDLETVSRSIPLWRSDWQCFPKNGPIGSQVHGLGVSWWLPLHGTGVGAAAPGNREDTYRVRSAFGSAIQLSAFTYEYTQITPGHPWAWHRRMIRDIRRAQPLFLGDYYPISGGTPDGSQWAIYQMHRRDLGAGFVMALRRPESNYMSATIPLKGLVSDARYVVENADNNCRRTMTGQELMVKGFPIELPKKPESRLVFYKLAGARR